MNRRDFHFVVIIMSISYEEALSTLQAMFGEPWTRESLDTVLRHFQGYVYSMPVYVAVVNVSSFLLISEHAGVI